MHVLKGTHHFQLCIHPLHVSDKNPCSRFSQFTLHLFSSTIGKLDNYLPTYQLTDQPTYRPTNQPHRLILATTKDGSGSTNRGCHHHWHRFRHDVGLLTTHQQGCADTCLLRYSGVAWAYSREPNNIAIVTSWEAELNHCSDKEKAPTQLWYNSNNDATWGYSIPADNDALKWFKLLLLKRCDIPADIATSEQLANARRLQEATGKQPVEIITCFLRKLWNHGIESIKRSIGAELLNKSKFHAVITLPAIWPPYAQRHMKQAAGLSGILDARSCGATTLRFVSEPEAAALATIQDLSKRSTIKVFHLYLTWGKPH